MSTLEVEEVVLDGHCLPWVSQVKHLGHMLENNNLTTVDCNLTRATKFEH